MTSLGPKEAPETTIVPVNARVLKQPLAPHVMSKTATNAKSTVITMQLEDIWPPKGVGRGEIDNVPFSRGAPETTCIGKYGGFVQGKSANNLWAKSARCGINGNNHTY